MITDFQIYRVSKGGDRGGTPFQLFNISENQIESHEKLETVRYIPKV